MINEILSVLGLPSVGSDLAFAVGSLWLWYMFNVLFDAVIDLIKGKN